MSTAYQAVLVKAPHDIGNTANDANVRKFTATTSHAANAIPEGWSGKYVSLYCTGGDVHYFFSKLSNAEVSTAVAATAAGASDKVGGVLADGLGNKVHVRVPSKADNETMYFVREATAATTVYMELSSD